jgi:hypothetical protein
MLLFCLTCSKSSSKCPFFGLTSRASSSWIKFKRTNRSNKWFVLNTDFQTFMTSHISFLLTGDDDSNSESTSGCSSLLPHLEHKRESRNIELSSLGVAEPLSINQSSLQIIGSSLSKSLAVDLKNSRGRKTLSLHTFGHDTSSGITPTEESRFHKDTGRFLMTFSSFCSQEFCLQMSLMYCFWFVEEASGSFFDKDDTSLNRSAAKRDLSQPQLSSYGSKRPRFNITSFGPSASVSLEFNLKTKSGLYSFITSNRRLGGL